MSDARATLNATSSVASSPSTASCDAVAHPDSTGRSRCPNVDLFSSSFGLRGLSTFRVFGLFHGPAALRSHHRGVGLFCARRNRLVVAGRSRCSGLCVGPKNDPCVGLGLSCQRNCLVSGPVSRASGPVAFRDVSLSSLRDAGPCVGLPLGDVGGRRQLVSDLSALGHLSGVLDGSSSRRWTCQVGPEAWLRRCPRRRFLAGPCLSSGTWKRSARSRRECGGRR